MLQAQSRKFKKTRPKDDEEDVLDESSDYSEVASKLELPRSRWLVLLVPLFAIAAAGSRTPWALGSFACLVGLCYLIAPPKMRVGPMVLLPLLGMLLCCLAVFLPVSEASFPEWRTMLSAEIGVVLPHLGTPQPWVSFESWTMLAVGVLWLVYCLGRGFNQRERRWIVSGLVLGIAAVAVAAIVVKTKGLIVPVWRGPWDLQYYGPFTNRNNFSSLLAVGSVLAFASAYDAYRKGQVSSLLLTFALVPIFAAILLNTSRAGVILFFMGLAAWMLLAGLHKRSGRRLSVFTSFLLLLATAFILFGQSIMMRFGWNSEMATLTGLDARTVIFFDTLRMVVQSPFFGVGLGNFEPVYALTELNGSAIYRNAHPESDWVWFLAECGVIALFFALFALCNILRRAIPSRASGSSSSKRERRMCNAAGIGALLVALHGFVDTPSHTVGVWSTVALLAGLALRQRHQTAGPSAWVPWAHRAAAVFCIAAGINWLSLSLSGKSLPGDSASRVLYEQALNLAKQGDYADALVQVNRALAMKPLQHNYYFSRAQWLLQLGRAPLDALADFSRARYLEPHNGPMCFAEVRVWLAHNNPQYAIPALREALARDPARAPEFFSLCLNEAGRFPELRQPLRLLANDPKQKLLYLASSENPKDFNDELETLLDLSPKLDALSPIERRTLFRLWYQRGDRARLIAILEKNLEWRQQGWLVLAEHRASVGDYRAAYLLAAEYVNAPSEALKSHENDIDQLRRSFLFNPTDIARGLELYEALKGRPTMLDEAAYTLEKIARLPDAPAKVFYEQSVLLARKGDYVKAWEKIKAYTEHLPHEDS